MYPVLDIVKSMKVGKQCLSAEDTIKHLNNCTTAEFDSRERKMIHKTVGPWLMQNCKRKYYPDASEMEKMAKSIVHFFPSSANPSSPSPWVCT